MAKFEEYIESQNPRTSHTDFLHQQLTSLFLLITPRVFGEPPEFPVAGIEHIASWSEVGSQGGSCPRQKEMRAAERSSSNFCTVVVQRRQRGPLQVDEPDPSGIALPPFYDVPLLPPISGPSLLIWLSRRLLLLFSLDALLVLAPPVDGDDGQPLDGGKLISPHIAHHPNQRRWKRY